MKFYKVEDNFPVVISFLVIIYINYTKKDAKFDQISCWNIFWMAHEGSLI